MHPSPYTQGFVVTPHVMDVYLPPRTSVIAIERVVLGVSLPILHTRHSVFNFLNASKNFFKCVEKNSENEVEDLRIVSVSAEIV